MLKSCIQLKILHTFQEVGRLFAYWEKYKDLWHQDKDSTVKIFSSQGPSLNEYESKMESYIQLAEKLTHEPTVYRIGAIQIKTGKT